MRAILTSVGNIRISRDAIEPLYVNYSATCAAIIRGGQKQTDDVTPFESIDGKKAFGPGALQLSISRVSRAIPFLFATSLSLSPRAGQVGRVSNPSLARPTTTHRAYASP